MMRLDRFLTDTTELSRSQAVKTIRAGGVTVNGTPVRSPEYKIDELSAEVCCGGKQCRYQKNYYYMLDKPIGVITASRDPRQMTVLDLFPREIQKHGIFPVGRLDKDTSGLLLLTNDGTFAHRIISPKSGIEKVYAATVSGTLEEKDTIRFREGMELEDGTRCLPAVLEIIRENECRVTVQEGKYHQVRRMLAAVGKPVLALRRLSIGELKLDPTLCQGNFRELNEDELCIMFNAIHMEK